MNHTRAVFQPASVKLKRNSFTFAYIAALPPIQCWKVSEQFSTQTIQFCTTLKEGGGGRSNEDFKSANLSNSFV